MEKIPFGDNAIDIITSSHALEPNGNRLKIILIELFRVARKRLILFEPSYEDSSNDGKKRMESFGYIKNLSKIISDLGGKLEEKIPIKNNGNDLNPTFAFVISPPKTDDTINKNQSKGYCLPGSNMVLTKEENFYISKQTGLCYPLLKNIPVLKSSAAILATSLITDLQ